MNYTVQETKEISAYNATFTFPDENITSYLNTDDFYISIRDTILCSSWIIDKTNYSQYGITSNDSDIDSREELSLINNGGLLIYCPTINQLYLKQLIPCQTENGNYIGFNTCDIHVHLTNDKSFNFTSKLLPAMQRDPNIVQVGTGDDPVLPETNSRQEYDFDTNSHSLEKINYDTFYTPNYTMGNTDAIYVNTPTSVPLYTSTVSAFLRSTLTESMNSFSDTVSSYLYDDSTGTYTTIDYDEAGPFYADLSLPHGLYTQLQYYEYTQKLQKDEEHCYKNRLILKLTTENNEVIDPLFPLGIVYSDPTPSNRQLNRNTNTGTINVKITNSNLGYRNYKPTVSITGFDNLTITNESFSPNTGTYTFTISGISLNAANDSGMLQVTAWLNIEDDPNRSQVSIQSDTTFSKSITWEYKVLPLGNVVIDTLKYYIKYNGDTEYTEVTPEKGNIKLDDADIGKIVATVVHPTDCEYKTTIPITAELNTHPHAEACSIANEYNTTTYTDTITISNIKVTPTAQVHAIQFFAYMNDTTGVAVDYTSDEVKAKTKALSQEINWTYEEATVLEHISVVLSDYVPDANDDGEHELTFGTGGALQTGSVKVTITNPNTDYRNADDILIDVYELLTPEKSSAVVPQNIIVGEKDFSKYSTDGIITFTVSNIKVSHVESLNNRYIYVTAMLNKEISTLTVEDVKAATFGCNTNLEPWVYFAPTPDIGEDEELLTCSLYTPSALTINGGYVGTRDIVCTGLTVNNGAVIDSIIYVTADSKVECNGSGNIFNESIYAPTIISNNPSTFNKPIYVKDSLILRGSHVDTLYKAEGCDVQLLDGSTIDHIYTWENPTFKQVSEITGTEFEVGTAEYVGNGNTFGINGGTGLDTYRYAKIDFNNGTGYYTGTEYTNDGQKHLYMTFYPGKYYMNSITTVPDTVINLLNYQSTPGNDGSIALYITESANFDNNTQLNANASGMEDFRIYYNGTGTLKIGVASKNQSGIIKAPNGTVSLANNAQWTGNIWAKNIELAMGARLIIPK